MTKPNILWIYCDELRADALHCYGNPYTTLQTPHIDALAADGTRFDRCYCNSPVCVASRASVLTGLHPEATGIYHNEACWENYRYVQQVETLPAVFARHGYATANFGKIHVPSALQHWQHSDTAGAGMQEFYADVAASEMDLFRLPGIPTVVGGTFPAGHAYPPEKVVDNALHWLGRADGPFFARISLLQPHTPVLPPPPYAGLYQDVPFPDTIQIPSTLSRFEQRFAEIIGAAAMSPALVRRAQAEYYGLVGWIDAQVGRLTDFLKAQDMWEQTVIVFDADHGASLGEAGRYQKQTFTPAGHRIPRIITWPGTLAPGRVRADLTQSLDLGRTLFALADIRAPGQFRGRNLFGDSPPRAVFSTIGYGFESSRAFPNLGAGRYSETEGWPRRACVRTATHRLDRNVRLNGDPVAATDARADIFLAETAADPGENRNIARLPAQAATVGELSALLDAHIAASVEVAERTTRRNPATQSRADTFRRGLAGE